MYKKYEAKQGIYQINYPDHKLKIGNHTVFSQKWHNYSSHTTTIDFKSTTSGSTMNFFYLHMANDSFG